MEMKDILAQHVAAFEEKLKGNDLAIAELKAMTFEIEQKMARRRGPSGPERAPSMGQLFVDNDDIKGMIGSAQAGRRYSVEMKAVITSATTDADGSAGDVLFPTRDPGIVPLAKRQLIFDGACAGRRALRWRLHIVVQVVETVRPTVRGATTTFARQGHAPTLMPGCAKCKWFGRA